MWCFHYVLWNIESLITVLMVIVMRQCNPSSLRECRNRQESMARRDSTTVGENYHKWPQGGCLRVTKPMKLFMWVILSFIRWPAGEISIWPNEPVNWGSVSWKAAFFIFFLFCTVFDNLKNMLPDYQRYSGWLWVIMFAMVFSIFKAIQNWNYWYFQSWTYLIELTFFHNGGDAANTNTSYMTTRPRGLEGYCLFATSWEKTMETVTYGPHL